MGKKCNILRTHIIYIFARKDVENSTGWQNICQKVTLIDGKNNISNQQLFDANKIVFPYLYINTGLIKQHARHLIRRESVYLIFQMFFQVRVKKKRKMRVFDGPHIWKLVKDFNIL